MVDTTVSKNKAAFAAAAAGQAALEQARAQLKAQKVALDYAEIRAPFDGVVLVKNANVGDILTHVQRRWRPGAVVTMADMSTLEVEADVSEGSLPKPRWASPSRSCWTPCPACASRVRVSGIVPTVDRAKATVMTRSASSSWTPASCPR